MTVVMSKKGQIVLPASVREHLHLGPGDALEILIQDDESIVLRKISRPPNEGLVEHLLACPSPFEVPERATDESAPVEL